MNGIRSLRSWASPLTVGTFGAVGLTGVLMFLHAGGGLVTGIHEWLGLVLVVAGGAHLAVNWRPFLRYVRQPAALALIVAPLVLGVVSLVSGGEGGEGHHGPPSFRGIVAALDRATLSDVAGLARKSPEVLDRRLRDAGLENRGGEATVAAIAAANNVRSEVVLAALFEDAGLRAQP